MLYFTILKQKIQDIYGIFAGEKCTRRKMNILRRVYYYCFLRVLTDGDSETTGFRAVIFDTI